MTSRLCRLLAGVVTGVMAAASWSASVHTQAPSTPSHWRTPEYRFDADWAKLPEVKDAAGVMRPQWTGGVSTVCVDLRNDHIVQFNRGHVEQMPAGMNAVTAAPIIIRDLAGKVIRTIGDSTLTPEGRSAVLPHGTHGCSVDYEGNIWVGGNTDGIVQKWSQEGKLLLQIGQKGVCDGPPIVSVKVWPTCGGPASNQAGLNNSRTLLNKPSEASVDPNPDPVTKERGSVYIADGYGNHRIVVFNSKGQYLRQWGSKGTGPGQFFPTGAGHPHCVAVANNGLVYVCDRNAHRIQVFDRLGNLKRVMYIMPLGVPAPEGEDVNRTPASTNDGAVTAVRSVSDLAFSPDPQQRYIYVVSRGHVLIVDHETGVVLAEVAGPGKEPGRFDAGPHGIAVDSKENIYAAETTPASRLQRFVKISR